MVFQIIYLLIQFCYLKHCHVKHKHSKIIFKRIIVHISLNVFGRLFYPKQLTLHLRHATFPGNQTHDLDFDSHCFTV